MARKIEYNRIEKWASWYFILIRNLDSRQDERWKKGTHNNECLHCVLLSSSLVLRALVSRSKIIKF